MIGIELQEAGKKFNREWIFRKLDLSIAPESQWVILGSNGSGKSTLLRVLAGFFSLNEGQIRFSKQDEDIRVENLYKSVAYASPYLELPGRFDLRESLDFHFQFKKPYGGMSIGEIMEKSGLALHRRKEIRNFSSGMRQRLRLTLAFCSDTPLLFLDEPSSNLDHSAVDWYRGMLKDFSEGRTVVVCSNRDEREFPGFANTLDLDELRT